MARQARTRQPKAKFDKVYICYKCRRQTNNYHLALVGENWRVVCYPTCPPPVPTPPAT